MLASAANGLRIEDIQVRPEGIACEANTERVLASLKH
jgi:hypothetical protein